MREADLHGAELGPAHTAEVGGLGWLLGQGGIVVGAGSHRVQREVELVLPACMAPGVGII